ncbi:putative HTH-type transcriptional regulator YusO [Geobacter sp. OR-1]|uniref:MarR family winged helix-turn-helix transcriptional regulator n=1 Tax=Geobacter sp. OR-1 TaxID=1266765 RepID=UPI0005423748|nr:MarR family transcriptional regulator [Geobacter sp. OR-1]GAM11862.1 putative HTH-type transcriptional regulator YusO [Geobacter sp. OR-1]
MTKLPDRNKIVAETIDDLRRIFQAVTDFSRQAERITGLTGSQLWAVKVIAESKSIKVSDLAKRMYLHPTTVVGILDRLEAQELVQRSRSKTDRRVVDVALTASGEKLVATSPDVAQGMLVTGLEKITDDKLVRIHEGMAEFVKILGMEEAPPRLILSNEVNIA